MILSPTDPPFGVNSISGSLGSMSYFGSCPEPSYKSSMGSSESVFSASSPGSSQGSASISNTESPGDEVAEFLVSSDRGQSVQPGHKVAMETAMTVTPPLQALRSLCSSICSDAFTAQSSEDVLSAETQSECTQYSQLHLAPTSQGTMSRVMPGTPVTPAAVPPSLVPAESQGLWRPWIYERER